jgi:metal-dependent amidase/aminoacylase/carboxypeptidase family protein
MLIKYIFKDQPESAQAQTVALRQTDAVLARWERQLLQYPEISAAIRTARERIAECLRERAVT